MRYTGCWFDSIVQVCSVRYSRISGIKTGLILLYRYAASGNVESRVLKLVWFYYRVYRYAASGNVESLRKLIIDLEADVNLPMKDGTTLSHCAAENGNTGRIVWKKKLVLHFFFITFILRRSQALSKLYSMSQWKLNSVHCAKPWELRSFCKE